jgi:Peptidase family C25
MPRSTTYTTSLAIWLLLLEGTFGNGCARGSEAPDPSATRDKTPSKTRNRPRPQVLETPPVTVRPPPRVTRSTPPPVDYLIVTASSLTASAQRWKEYRERSGHRVAIVLTRDLDPRSTAKKARPDALRQEIRAHIKARFAARDRTKPFYVLLLGDAPSPLPAWIYRKAKSPIVTDNPYADMDGDGIPDLALGRIPALSDAEVDTVRAKVERYESTYRVGLWNRRINLFGAPGNFGAFVDSLIEGLTRDLMEQLSYDYDLHMLYGAKGSPAAYPPQRFSDRVYELLNAGSLFTVYIGHGTPKGPQYGWWNGKSYDLWKVAQLERKLRMRNRPPILLLVACEMGTFAGADGLGEKLLRHGQGPPAVIAATGVSHPYPNTLLVREMGRLSAGLRVRTVGLLLQRAKARMIRQRDSARDVIDTLAAMVSTRAQMDHLQQTHLRLYVLLGDPALKIPYVSGRAKLQLPTPPTRPGDPLVVTARFPTPKSGVARFTLETRRKIILGHLHKLPKDSDPRRDSVLLDNNRTANDKVVSTQVLRYIDGLARATLPIPKNLPPGQYYVKVYAQDGHTDAMGSLAARIR